MSKQHAVSLRGVTVGLVGVYMKANKSGTFLLEGSFGTKYTIQYLPCDGIKAFKFVPTLGESYVLNTDLASEQVSIMTYKQLIRGFKLHPMDVHLENVVQGCECVMQVSHISEYQSQYHIGKRTGLTMQLHTDKVIHIQSNTDVRVSKKGVSIEGATMYVPVDAYELLNINTLDKAAIITIGAYELIKD